MSRPRAIPRNRRQEPATVDPRPLVACSGGPLDRRWYWLADFEVMRTAARRMGHGPTDPAGTALAYRETQERIPNPLPQYGDGIVWSYTPTQVHTTHTGRR